MSLGKVFATTAITSAVIVMGLLASGVQGADAVGKNGAAKAAAVTTVPGMPPGNPRCLVMSGRFAISSILQLLPILSCVLVSKSDAS